MLLKRLGHRFDRLRAANGAPSCTICRGAAWPAPRSERCWKSSRNVSWIRKPRCVLRFRRLSSANRAFWRLLQACLSLSQMQRVRRRSGALLTSWRRTASTALVEKLNDVKLIEGDCGPGQMLTHASLVACRHTHTDRAAVPGTGTMSLERIGKLGHDPGFSPFAGIEHTLGIEIVRQADVIVSMLRGGLVETSRGDGREVLLSVRLIDVMVEGYARHARR